MNTGMNAAELVALLVSAGLLIYLTTALLKPEWFS
jgi:K+-transporting ATPase KdpF subunit